MNPIVIEVDDAPPAKDGASSILAPGHRDAPRVAALRTALEAAMAGRAPFEGLPLALELRVVRARSRADGLNTINGVADVLQRRCATAAYAPVVWAIDDDRNIKEFHYAEEPGDRDRYRVTIRVLGA